MTPRAFLILAGLTGVAVVGAAWAVIAEQRDAVSVAPTDDAMFPALTAGADAVTRVEIATPGYTMNVTRDGDRWVAADMANYPVKTGPVGQVVAGLASLRPFEAKTTNPAWYDEIGVADPTPEAKGTTVRAIDADGEPLAEAIIGQASRSIGNNPLGGTFIRMPGDGQAWLAEGTVVLPSYLSDWFDAIVHIPGPEIKRVTVLEGETVVFDAEKTDLATGDYELKTLDAKYQREEGLVAADNNVKSVATGVVSTTFEDARPESELQRGADARTIRFETTKGMTIDVRLGQIDGTTWAAYTATAPAGAEDEARAAQITARTAGFAFKLPPYRLTPLERQVADLVEQPGDDQLPQGMPGVGGPQLPGGPLIPRLPGFGPGARPGLPGQLAPGR